MKLYFHGVRSVLAYGLTLMVFLPTLTGFVAPIRVSASPQTTKDTTSTNQLSSGKVGENIDGYIIEQVNGVAVCRRARPDERPSIVRRPEDRGVPVKQVRAGRDSLRRR